METITKKRTDLELKVLSVNTLYEFAQKCIDYELNHFKQFLGKDIFKVDGSVKAKYDHEKTSFDGSLEDGTHFNVHYWFTSSYGYFDIHVKSCINGGTYDIRPSTAFCIYEETVYTMFRIKETEPDEMLHTKNILVENTERTNNDYSKRFNAEEIEDTAKELEAIAGNYRNVYDAIPHYFRGSVRAKRLEY